MLTRGEQDEGRNERKKHKRALCGFIPYLTAFGRETAGKDWINQFSELQCPDPVNTVVFFLQRY